MATNAAGALRIADVIVPGDPQADQHHDRSAISLTHDGTSCVACGEMLAERDAAAPESGAALGLDEDAVEQRPANTAPSASSADRDQHRPRAFVRVIAGRSRSAARPCVVRAVAMRPRPGIVVIVVDRVLDMLADAAQRGLP